MNTTINKLDADEELALDTLVSDFSSRETLDDAESFLKSHPLGSDPRIAARFRNYVVANQHIDQLFEQSSRVDSKRVMSNSSFDPSFPEVDGFQVTGILGRGGMGIVYRGMQLSIGREVALKLIRSDWSRDARQIERFRTEIHSLCTIQAPHVVPVIDVAESDRGPVLVMACIQGKTLREIVNERKHVHGYESSHGNTASVHPWSLLPAIEFEQCVARLFGQLLQAVTAIHSKRLLHRDIKPSNILVDHDNQIWLGDFGLARAIDTTEPADGIEHTAPLKGLTQTGAVVGTVGYVAPEVLLGESADERSDLYSCGATVFELLTGRLPDYGFNIPSITADRNSQIAREELRSTKTQGAETPEFEMRDASHLRSTSNCRLLQFVVERLLADRDKRPTSAAIALDELRSFTSERNSLFAARTPARQLRLIGSILAIVVAGIVVLSMLKSQFSGAPAVDVARPDNEQAEAEPVADPASVLSSVTFDVFKVVVPITPIDCDVVMLPLNSRNEPMIQAAIFPTKIVDGYATFHNVPRGVYLVEVGKVGTGFTQAYRRVAPESIAVEYRHVYHEYSEGTIRWMEIAVKPPVVGQVDMAYFDNPIPHYLSIDDVELKGTVEPGAFWLDTTEVTRHDVTRVLRPGKEFGANQVPPSPASPACYVTYDMAAAYAELVGKRLPTEFEFYHAATNGGTTRFPHGNDEPVEKNWDYGTDVGTPVSDHSLSEPPIYGLVSNVAEWTSTAGPRIDKSIQSRLIRCASPEVFSGRKAPTGSPERREVLLAAHNPSCAYPKVGFRCARSERPFVLPWPK